MLGMRDKIKYHLLLLLFFLPNVDTTQQLCIRDDFWYLHKILTH